MWRLLATALWLLPTLGWAGTMASVGSTIGSATATQLTETYFILPDNQNIVVAEDADPAPTRSDLQLTADWVCANRATHNIKAAVTLGDLVRTAATAAYWTIYAEMRDVFVACRMPLLPTYGNHDGADTVEVMSIPQNATNFHVNVGQDWMDVQPWFSGERPDWTQVGGPGAFNGVSLYTENTTTYASRSYWVRIPPLVFINAEWEFGIRWGARDGRMVGYPAANAEGWALNTAATNPSRYTVFVTHAGPCHPPVNCDLTPERSVAFPASFDPTGAAGDYTSWLDDFTLPNMFVHLNGHWGRQSCLGGGGVYAQGVRDDGSRWLAGGYDTNCSDRRDQVALNTCPNGAGGAACVSNPYTWQGWMRVKRASHQVCLDTIRVLDVDADNNGNPNVVQSATDSCYAGQGGCSLVAPQIGQGALGFPVITDLDCTEVNSNDEGTVIGCPTQSEFCMDIEDILR